MEAEQTNNAPAEQPLKIWWDAAVFEGKEFCDLKDDGTLVLKKTPFSEERSLGTLTPEGAPATVKALVDKFPEVAARFVELQQEWNATEDKLKMVSKVSRTRDYMLHANAIGDFEPMYRELAAWHNVINELVEANAKGKRELVEKAKTLAESDNWKETTQAFKDLAEQWKASGFIERDRNDSMWNELEAARDKFFERKRAYQEGHEKEMLQNLDLKMELVEKAEKLAATDSWKQTTEGFKALMDEWKTIGRTMNDKNESLWQRFIAAQNVFFERKRQHYEVIRQEQEVSYAKKLSIIERAEALSESTDWLATTNAYAGLMDEWKSSGRVAGEKADELWDRMSKAKDVFFNNKRHHFESQRVTLDDNLAQKAAIIKRAEQLKHSTNWRETTAEFAELFEDWKKIGPAPRAENEKLWEQFAQSRRAFFERKDADWERRKGQMDKQAESRLQQARQFLQTLRDELKDDEEGYEDWKQSLANLTPGPKEKEIRAHLEKLIAQADPGMKKKHDKIADVEKQVRELEARMKKEKEEKNAPKAKAPKAVAETSEPRMAQGSCAGKRGRAGSQ